MSVNIDTGLAGSAKLQGAEHALQSAELAVAPAPREAALRSDRFWTRVHVGLDLLLLAAAAVIADLTSSLVTTFGDRVVWPALFGGIVVCLSYFKGAYAPRVQLDALDDLRSTGSVVAVAASIVVTLRLLIDNASAATADQTVQLGIIAALALACGRISVNLWQAQARRHGSALAPTLIVGAGHIGRTTARRLLEHPELGLKPIGFLDKEPLEQAGVPLPVLGASWDFDQAVQEHGVRHVIITFSTAPSEVLLRLVNRCEELGIERLARPAPVREHDRAPDDRAHRRLAADHLASERSQRLAVRGQVRAGPGVAARALVLLAPLLLICAIAVWLSLGRPILFRQRRVGLDGREFEMLKFRSMRPNESCPDSPDSLPDDTGAGRGRGTTPAVTRSERFLRRHVARRAAAALQRAQGRDVARRPAARAPGVRRALRASDPPLRRPPPRQARDHGLGAGQRPPWPDLAVRSGRVGQLLHRERSLWLDLKIVGRTMSQFVPRHSR